MAVNPAIFNDEIVSATELNRQSGRILQKALHGPVTIVRNDEAFALMPREQAGQLAQRAAQAEAMVDLLRAICRRISGSPLGPDYACEWVAAFDAEDLGNLAEEAFLSFRKAMSGEGGWDGFVTVLHEWQESAWAARSSELSDAFHAPAGEVPLSTPPGSQSEE